MDHGKNRNFEVYLPSTRVWWHKRQFLRPVLNPQVDSLPQIPVVPCPDEKIKSNLIIPSYATLFSATDKQNKKVSSRQRYECVRGREVWISEFNNVQYSYMLPIFPITLCKNVMSCNNVLHMATQHLKAAVCGRIARVVHHFFGCPSRSHTGKVNFACSLCEFVARTQLHKP